MTNLWKILTRDKIDAHREAEKKAEEGGVVTNIEPLHKELMKEIKNDPFYLDRHFENKTAIHKDDYFIMSEGWGSSDDTRGVTPIVTTNVPWDSGGVVNNLTEHYVSMIISEIRANIKVSVSQDPIWNMTRIQILDMNIYNEDLNKIKMGTVEDRLKFIEELNRIIIKVTNEKLAEVLFT